VLEAGSLVRKYENTAIVRKNLHHNKESVKKRWPNFDWIDPIINAWWMINRILWWKTNLLHKLLQKMSRFPQISTSHRNFNTLFQNRFGDQQRSVYRKGMVIPEKFIKDHHKNYKVLFAQIRFHRTMRNILLIFCRKQNFDLKKYTSFSQICSPWVILEIYIEMIGTFAIWYLLT
jgi:hypothetical protein